MEETKTTEVNTEERKAILLSKAQADLKTFASKDPTRLSLNYIHVTREYAEATEGHILVRVPHDGMSTKEWPAVKGVGQGLNGDSVLVDHKLIDKAFKHTDKRPSLPILNYVHLSLDENESPILTATDLESSVNIHQRKADSTFPDTDAVIPTGRRKKTVCISADLLSILANWATKHGPKGVGINFYIESPTDSILCKVDRGYDGPPATVVIAPMRSSMPAEIGKEPVRLQTEESMSNLGEEAIRAIVSPSSSVDNNFLEGDKPSQLEEEEDDNTAPELDNPEEEEGNDQDDVTYGELTYTTAGEEYDGFGTRTIKASVGTSNNNSRNVRLVATPNEYVRWQRMRYVSGLHAALTQEEWQEWLDNGFATVNK